MNGKDLHEKEKMLKEAANKPQDDKNNKPGLYYASGSRDKVIKICETATGRCITTLVSFFNANYSLFRFASLFGRSVTNAF